MSPAQRVFEDMKGHRLLNHKISERNFFGFRSLVIKNKSFVILFEDGIVVKLNDKNSKKALALTNTSHWNPFGREKKKWILIPEENSQRWNDFMVMAGKNILNESGA